ncbi:SdpI family protein [Streptobacillus canis]|uniref:SdpI family protein n=1 Tax=Streptobacillus canis TaxID=2678686 RepID=UPI0018CC605F|nr:SdpI family protein [Streptobacillus canis]
MLNKKKVMISIVLCLLPIIYGLAVYSRLPEMIPTHWNFSGEIDGYTSKNMFIFGMPLLFAAINAFSIFGVKEDPRNAENQKTFLFKNFIWLIPIMSNFIMIITILVSLGYNISVSKLIFVPIAILFIVLGNYMPKCKQNYTIGIRTPWTLNDEDNWNRTHRFGGKMFVLAGIVTLFSVITEYAFFVSFVFIFAPTVYSYLIYKKII